MTYPDFVLALRAGDLAAVRSALGADPSLIDHVAQGDPRSALHHVTDWPANLPDAPALIALIVDAGVDPDIPFGDPGVSTERPLHWAASADDVPAIDALLAAGADIDATGGVFDGCPAIALAGIFANERALQRLFEAGADHDLPVVAAMGRLELVERFLVDGEERVLVAGRTLPHLDAPVSAQLALDAALFFAARGGHDAVCARLAAAGADPSRRMPDGASALDFANGDGDGES